MRLLRRLRCAIRGYHLRPRTRGADALLDRGLPVRCTECGEKLWPRRPLDGEVRFK